MLPAALFPPLLVLPLVPVTDAPAADDPPEPIPPLELELPHAATSSTHSHNNKDRLRMGITAKLADLTVHSRARALRSRSRPGIVVLS
jgi:hypothetical protein